MDVPKVVEGYSEKEREKLRKNLKRYEPIEFEVLSNYFETDKAKEIMSQNSIEYENIIPTIPYIGGKENGMTQYLLLPSPLISLVKILKKEGLKTRTIGKIMFECAEKLYENLPRPFKWFLRWKLCKKSNIKDNKEGAEWSQKRIYPMDWVYEFIEGEGEDFEYGIDMKECGLVKYWKKLGLEEFVPYLCLTDWALWRAIKVKTHRSQTLANGGEVCDYRFYKGKFDDCPKGWPPEYLLEWTGKFEKEGD
ncbi:MAG: hypothetical protein BAJALOKI2v1_280004 [Promethearchaeota archaeon]|nr:MAG: hypothetical protein BAJALOKI2v1_280004 [Candidatus Lokiarchaeota archaeon]